MSLSDKPFACNEKNCFRTFANEDHLNAHIKKHSMSFNLDLSNKNNEAVLADQTPTPTSFFRNCEEVGLFQDLQNVNPFEETFKKAIESSDNKIIKLGTISDVHNEDTLHTPHVFPSVEEAPHNNTILDTNNSELSIVSLIEIPSIPQKTEFDVISNPNSENKQSHLKGKLKEALMKKDKLKTITNDIPNYISTPNRESQNTDSNDGTDKHDKSNIERIREINRVAQMKCRVKKKRQMDKMVTELMDLKKENVKLKRENARLNACNIHLWKALEEFGGAKDSSLINRIRATLEEIDKDDHSEEPRKKLPALKPADPSVLPKNPAQPAPIIFNLVPVQILNGTPPPVTLLPKNKILPRILKKT